MPGTRDSAADAAVGMPAAHGELWAWRDRLCSVLLFASSVLHVAGLLVYVLAVVSPRPAVVFSSALVGVVHFGASRVRGLVRARSWMYLATLFAELVVLGAFFAWAPVVVLALLFGTVVGGILLGRWGALMMPVGAGALLLLGAWGVSRGYRFDETLLALDGPSWVRVAILYAVLVATIAFSLRRALGLMVSVRHQATQAIELAGHERDQLDRTRTSRVATEAVVRDAQKLQTVAQLSGGIAHLLNNTLTVVRGAAEQLAETRTPARVHEVVRVVIESVQRAAETTRELLVFSRKDEPQVEPTLLTEQFPGTTLQQALPDNIQLRWHLESTPPVLVEPVRLHQLVLNLVLNARDALPSGGTVELGSSVISVSEERSPVADAELHPGRYVALSVSDDGEGMSPQVAARASEPFFTTRDPARHEGLGLFVVFGMVRQWGGALRIESAPGQGTRVTVFLPVAPEDGLDARSSGDERGAAAASPLPPAVAVHSPSPVPPRFIDDWKEPILTRLALFIAIAFGAAYLAHLLAGRGTDLLTAILTPSFCVVSLLAWRARRAPIAVRFVVLISAVFTTTASVILVNGYMTPAAVAAHAIVVLLVAVYMGSVPTLAAVLVTTMPFVVAAQGPVLGYWNDENVQLSDPMNWVRVAMVLPAVVLITTRLVLDVLRTVETAVVERERSLAELLRTRRERAQEVQSLGAAQAVATRATRLEAAGRLAGSVAHDLNNALGGVLGWASLLVDDPDPSEADIHEAIAAFNESVDLASALVLQLEPHTTPATGTEVATDLGAMIERYRGVAQRLLRDHIRIEIDVCVGCYVPISPSDLQRALLNLTANARDAMARGGVLTLRCSRDPVAQQAVLEVQDDGVGMSEETQRRAFEAFFTTKVRGQGTGLGLHTVAHIVQASGGTIELESKLGQGTCFRLRWPLAARPPPCATVSRAVARHARGRILLAEDNEWVRGAMARGLARAGYDVEVAVDGDDARQRVESADDWDALCTDAVMPGYSSAALIRDFKARFPERPVIVCSGYLSHDVSELIDAGGVRFLPKPFAPSALVGALQDELSKA